MFVADHNLWPRHVSATRSRFTPEEDVRLKQIVSTVGTRSWAEVARLLGNRTPRQCRERYKNYLSPELVNGEWTSREERLLERLYADVGPVWAQIAHNFPHRSNVNIKNHWCSMVNRKCKCMDEKGPSGLVLPEGPVPMPPKPEARENPLSIENLLNGPIHK